MSAWWRVVMGNLDDLARCASLWGGVVCSEKAVRSAASAQNYAQLRHCLQEIWWKAPDTPDIHKQPGWSVLCSLLDGTVPVPPGEEEDVSG